MTAIVLAGGRPSIPNPDYPGLPTALIPILGAPFLVWLTYWLKQQQIMDIVYAAGYGGDKVQAWASDLNSQHPSLCLDVVIESRLQGTGGAIALCAKRFPDDYFIIVNGDSLLLTDLTPALAQLKAQPEIDGIVLGTPHVANAGRFGALSINEAGLLAQFAEKQPNRGVINAGIYILRKHVIDDIPMDKVCSMEADCFPNWLAKGRKFQVIASEAPFLDIGTPESLIKAELLLRKNPMYLKQLEETATPLQHAFAD